MTITINNQKFDLTDEQVVKLKKALDLPNKTAADIENGETFNVGGIEFIKFCEKDGKVYAVTREALFDSKFGETNNVKESDILKTLESEILPKLVAAVGEENILEFETDLTTLDGLKDYGTMKSKIGLPTFDFYREYTEIFEEYKLDDWFFLSTAWSTPKRGYKYGIVCVSPSCIIDCDNCGINCGVRPFCIFNSSIFVS